MTIETIFDYVPHAIIVVYTICVCIVLREAKTVKPKIKPKTALESQLIEATWLAQHLGHGRNALDRENCELCESLHRLREALPRCRRAAVAMMIQRRGVR